MGGWLQVYISNVFRYPAKRVCAYNTYQFRNYADYEMEMFDEEDKRHYRDEHFAKDLKSAYYAKARDGRYAEVDIDYMTKDQIENVIRMFVEAGRRAAEARFDGIQIHAAHFFFLVRHVLLSNSSTPILSTLNVTRLYL